MFNWKKNSILLLSVFIYLINIIDNCNASDEFKVVKTDSGLVRGKKILTLFENKPYYSFKGIPYASPPVKDLRFKAPKPIEAWKGVKDAFEFGNECTQAKEIFGFAPVDEYIVGDENCLFINVYTPDVTANLPVMFFIHGGAFTEGSANIYGPDFIINQDDVVLVTINYRLGIFGFASFDTSEYSGNMGLKDQLFALKWVNKNIGNFGGNKDLVTIFGESAGAGSTHYHTITQQNSKLFKRAIVMSGSAKSIWAVRPFNDHSPHLYEMARRIGNPVYNKDDLLNLVTNIDAKILVEHAVVPLYQAGLPRKTITFFNYVPLIENSTAQEPYLTEDVNEIIGRDSYKSTIDTMFGFTSMESFFIVTEEIKDVALLKSFNKKYEIQLPLDHDVDIQYNSKEYKKISKAIRDFYFGENGIVDNNSIMQYIDLQSAVWITYPVDVAVKQQAVKSSGKTYYYTFSVDTDSNIVKKLLNISLPGASHFDEICYMFRCPFPMYDSFVKNSKARKTMETITKLWVNFAKYGNPSIPSENIEIHPVQDKNINYFDINNNGITIGKNPRKEIMDFWDNIYLNYKNKYKKLDLKIKTEL